MVAEDITHEFRSILHRSKSTHTPRSKSPFRTHSPSPKGKEKAEGEEFLKEAYRIHAHLVSLSTLLSSIKKAYLSTSTAPLRRHERGLDQGDDQDGLERWKDSKFLSDRERDEIDLRAKVIIRRCKERVYLLEQAEKGRQNKLNPPAISTLYTFLPSLAPSDTMTKITETLVTAHRSSVIWTLNDMLAKTSGEMGKMQEERYKRRQERSKSLGGMVEKESGRFTSTKGLERIEIPQSDITTHLSKDQIQQFELENNALIDHMESQLDTVLKAEKSLLEISQLQTELINHLATQTELTERLYDEAVGTVGEVGKANVQLKQARKRGEEGRLFLLIFLVGASFALLFLDWYS